MGRRPGLVLLDRDKQVIQYLALARYLTADQLHRLLGGRGRVDDLAARLRRLADRAAGAPLLRGIRYDGAREMWTLTPLGWEAGQKAVPYAPAPPARDIAAASLRHEERLNEVLLALLDACTKGEDHPVTALPFRWYPETEEQLSFEVMARDGAGTVSVKPDAIIEAPGAGRRLFLEFETGSRNAGITTGSLRNDGAIVMKLKRYGQFFTGLASAQGASTWYTQRFPDGLKPEVVLIVHSADRKQRVEIAREKWARHLARAAQPRVLVEDEAGPVLALLVAGTEAYAAGRVFAVREKAARELRDSFNALIAAVNAHRDVIEAHNRVAGVQKLPIPDLPPALVRRLSDLIRHDLFGEPSGAVPWASRMLDPPQREGSRG